MKKKVYLIRHAESEANAGGRTSEPSKVALSPAGIKQAEEMVALISEMPESIVTSSYIRTTQTAAPLMKKSRKTPHEEWEVHEFTYLAPGRCKNTSSPERRPMVEEYWKKCDPFYCDGEGAESFDDFINRVKRTLGRLRSRRESVIAIFSHEQFIKALLWVIDKGEIARLSSEDMKEYKDLLAVNRIPNCGIVEIEI
ncbi:MAG: histidine phosphatase family protein [Candidatus Omnitrophota bacterium]|jgi:broad specificity phosphatase PhoE